VYFERVGGINIQNMFDAGLSMEDIIRHYIFITEFLWEELQPHADARVLTVLDVRGVGLKDARGKAMDFIRQASKFQAAHYPERSFQIWIINVPSWFGLIWKVIYRMLDEVTRSKVHIYSDDGYKARLLEVVDAASLPVEYGGTCTCCSPEEFEANGRRSKCETNSEEEIALRELVVRVNGEAAAKVKVA